MKRNLLLLVACLTVVVGRAQNDTTQSRILTFEEAVSIALQNSVLLNQQRNVMELNQMQKISAIAGIAPSVNANASLGRNVGNTFIQQIGVVSGTVDGASGSISANLNLFSGFARVNTIRQMTKALDAQSYFVNRTAQDAINLVATQYLTVMRDVELLRIAKQNYEALNKQLEQITEMMDLGSKSDVDKQNQNTLTRGAELRMVQAEIQLNNDKTLLQQTLLIDPFMEFEVEKPNWDSNYLGEQPLNIEELTDRAKAFRGDYLRSLKQEESYHYALYAARGGYLPSLSASATYLTGWNFRHGVDPSSADYPRPFKTQITQDNIRKSVGLNLNIPLFNGFQQRAFVTQARVTYENQKITTRNLEFQVKNDVIRAVRNFDGAKRAFAVTTAQLSSAEIAFEYETQRYNLGVTSFVDYANANRMLVQSQTDKAQAEYTLVFQRILLEYSVGTLKPEDITATKN
ncbi:MAG: TolC family protein [Bacteroidota bacterium]